MLFFVFAQSKVLVELATHTPKQFMQTTKYVKDK